jgi:AcrR family transcriptional regulator
MTQRVLTRAPALPPEERRAAIVEVTIPLLIRDGLQIKTSDVAAAAGIAEGTVFRAFPDKRALLSATIAKVCDASEMDAAIDAIDPTLSLEAQLVAAVEILQKKFIDVWQVLGAVGPRVPVPRPSAHPALARLLKPFADELRLPPGKAAKQIAAVVVATSMPSIYVDAPLSPREIVRLVLDGVSR